MMNYIEERNSHLRVGIVLPITLVRDANSTFTRTGNYIEKLKMKSHHLQAFKVHYLLLYNLFSLLYIVNNNCFGD